MNTLLAETTLPCGQNLQLVRGDITAETTEAIVNAANAHLRHGAGVAGAILRRGGTVIRDESDAWLRTRGPVRPEAPAWTSGGNLSCRYVIHAVGPVWGEAPAAEADAQLAAAVTGSLKAADGLDLASLALPAISTGNFGFPHERAAGVILSAIRDYFTARESKLTLIRVVLFDEPTVEAFRKAWHDHFDA